MRGIWAVLIFFALASGPGHADDVADLIMAPLEYPKVTGDPEGAVIGLINRFCQKGWRRDPSTDLAFVWQDLTNDGLPDMIASPAAWCRFKLKPEWQAHYPIQSSNGVESIIYFAVSTQEWRLGWRGTDMLLFPNADGWFTQESLDRYLDDWIAETAGFVSMWDYLSPPSPKATFQAVFTHHSPCLWNALAAQAPEGEADWVKTQWMKIHHHPCFTTYSWDGCTLLPLETNWPDYVDWQLPTCREE